MKIYTAFIFLVFFSYGCTCTDPCLARDVVIKIVHPSGEFKPFRAVVYSDNFQDVINCLSLSEEAIQNGHLCTGGHPSRTTVLDDNGIPDELSVEISFGIGEAPTQFYTVKVKQGDTYEGSCVANCADYFATVTVGE